MPLAPPPIGVPANGAYNLDLPTLIEHVNKHAAAEGYAVVLARTKASKKNVKFKAWLRCDRGGKPKTLSEGAGQRAHGSTRLQACPFIAIAKLNVLDERWYISRSRLLRYLM